MISFKKGNSPLTSFFTNFTNPKNIKSNNDKSPTTKNSMDNILQEF